MAYCTKSEVKAYLEIKDSEESKDALIETLITISEAFIDEYCGQLFSQSEIVEYHDGGSNKIFLNSCPVEEDSVEVWDSWDRTYGNPDVIPSSDFFVDCDNGTIKFDYDVGGSPGAVKVSYTGGYEDVPLPITQACIELVARKLKEGPSGGLGVPSRALPGGGNVTFVIDDILPQTKVVLDLYRKSGRAG